LSGTIKVRGKNGRNEGKRRQWGGGKELQSKKNKIGNISYIFFREGRDGKPEGKGTWTVGKRKFWRDKQSERWGHKNLGLGQRPGGRKKRKKATCKQYLWTRGGGLSKWVWSQ